METLDYSFFKSLLIRLRRELTGQMGQIIDSGDGATAKEASGDHSSYSFHIADQGTDTMDREQSFMVVQRDGMTLREVDEALERLENGTYGQCVECSASLPKERLEFMPYARLCIQCKAAEESRAQGWIEDEGEEDEEWS